MQSKLEFEQQKKNFVIKTSTEVSQGKKKKGKTMRLDEFLESNKETEQKNKGKNYFILYFFVSIGCKKILVVKVLNLKESLTVTKFGCEINSH